MPYAVNICDMTAFVGPDEPLNIFALLLNPVTPGRVMVKANPKYLDEGAILLECDEERAEAICLILRRKFPEKWKMRLYHSKTGKGGWKRI